MKYFSPIFWGNVITVLFIVIQWFIRSLEDGKITPEEFGKLITAIMRKFGLEINWEEFKNG